MNKLRSIIILLCLGMIQLATAQTIIWRDAPEPAPFRANLQGPIPEEFRSLRLEKDVLGDFLQEVPLSDSLIFSIPRPDGGEDLFRIYPVEVMAPALASNYPQIRTYAGESRERPLKHLRLTVAPQGVHAMILAPEGEYFIGPYRQENEEQYHCYFRRHFPKGSPSACDLERALGFRSGSDAFPRIGDTLRTYRLAVSTTGEYTRYHGGTVERALSAIVTIINRVNGIFRRDLSVELQLINNNDELIFLDPDTDPFTKDNERLQNQEVIDSRIGTDNYDIGHVFGTVAQLSRASVASACVEGEKAKALSRLDMPEGDPFAIDIVAHEIGHQLGANHTFNKCGDNQGMLPFEPGSGSTIMGWPGVSFCESENFQQRADAYFHSASIREITNFVRGGEGSTCAELSPLNNTAPEVEAGTGGWTIPVGTPFELTGAATDADGNTLTYSWEQIDAGPSTPLGQPRGTAPLFRARPPMVSPTRVFPRLEDLLANRDPVAEVLPSYTRPLTFRLTVRDQRGGVAADSLRLNVTADAGPFRLTTLNQPGEVVESGAMLELSWEVAGTNRPPVAADSVELLLSADGGRTFPLLLASALPNNGTALIPLPDTLEGEQFRLKMKAKDNVFFDVNDYDFAIRTPATSVDPSVVEHSSLRLFPNPAHDHLWIALDRLSSPSYVFLWDATGRLIRRSILNQEKTLMEITDLVPGLYWVEVHSNSDRRFACFVKTPR